MTLPNSSSDLSNIQCLKTHYWQMTKVWKKIAKSLNVHHTGLITALKKWGEKCH